MARTARISEEELQQALKLRDKATTATELRKAMTVILFFYSCRPVLAVAAL
jgi:hypothetical protein